MSAALRAHMDFLPTDSMVTMGTMPGMPSASTLGWPIHLKALHCIERMKEKFERQYTWMNEALVEAKRTFASPEIHMIPKTPSAKKCRNIVQEVIEEEDDDFEQPKKKRIIKMASKPRQICKKLAEGASSMSSDDCTDKGSETSASDSGKPTRSTRTRGSQKTTANSNRATRTSRRNKQEVSEDRAAPEPIMSKDLLENAHEGTDPGSEDTEEAETVPTPPTVTKLSKNKRLSSKNKPQQISDNVNMSSEANSDKEEMKVVVTEPTPRVTRRSQSLGQHNKETQNSATDTSQMVVISDSEDDSTPKVTRVCKKARRTLSVGTNGQQNTLNPQSPQTPTTPPRCGGNKAKPFHMLNVKEKATKYEELVRRSDGSREASPMAPSTPRSQRPCQKTALPSPSQSPRYQRHQGSMTPSNRSVVSKARLVLTKQDETKLSSSPKLTSIKVKAASSDTPSPGKSSGRRRSSCRVSGSKLSMSRRRSSIQRHKERQSIEQAALSHLQEIKSRLANTITAAQHMNQSSPVIRSTRSKTRAAKPEKTPAKTPEPPKSKAALNKVCRLQEQASANQSESTPPRRTTRSKMRLNKAPPPTLSDSDQGDSTPTSNSNGYRVTTQAPKTGSGNAIRSKMYNQDLACSPLTVKKTVGASRSNSVKRQAASHDEQNSPPKKQCFDSEEYEDVDSDGVPGTPSRYHTPPGNVHSFLNNLKKKKQATPGNLNCTVTSFLQRNTPSKKPSSKEIVEQRRKQLLAKEKQEEDRLAKRQEYLQKKAEDQRKKREQRQLLAAKRREEQLKKEKEIKKGFNQKLEEKKMLTAKMQEEKHKEDKEKQKIREKKMAEAELRRKQEEESRHQKMVEMKQEQERLKELQQRKKDFEEQERLKRIAEQRRAQEERSAEVEREKQKSAEKLRLQDEQRAREEQLQRKEREEREKKDKAERDRQDLEKQKEKQRQKQVELEKQREMERQRVLTEKKDQEEKRLALEEERRLQKLIKSHNNALQQNTSLNQQNTSANQSQHSKLAKPQLNTTVNMDTSGTKLDSTFTKDQKADTSLTEDNPDSYKITPVRKVYKPPIGENYNIYDLKSDDSTDDEDAPRKKIPSWATGPQLKAAIISQYYQPPDLDKIFDIIELPDLCKMFVKKKAKFFKRTSSAVWHTPIYMPSGKPCE